ncbi:phosphate uptake regulator PhoU [Candidatus Bathyarchaeota archaeon]|nr:MAG: phosphate uptake regulator PhoU [Candidatus Bathyarchaeota archaeon]
MARLMDLGLEKLRNMVLDMAELSENTVSTAIDAYVQGKDLRERIYNWSEELRMLQDEVSELAVEIIARYQPVASDLRFVKSCMEVAYGFSRFGRYAHDISDVFGIFGDLSTCDKTAIERVGSQAKEMIRLSIKAFTERNVEMASKLPKMDDVVDDAYLDFVKRSATSPDSDTKCMISGTLILRYLERIADHATYVGESVAYIVSGERAARK